MKSLRTLIGMFTLLVLAAGMVFATGQPEVVAEPEPTAAPEPTEAPVPEVVPKTELTFFWTQYDGMQAGFGERIQKAFNDSNSDYNMTLIPVARDEVLDKLKAAIAEGNPPDLCIVGTDSLLQLVEMDAIAGVSDYVSATTLDNIIASTMQGTIGGTLMGLPFAANPRFMAYNANITTAAPFTMEELQSTLIGLPKEQTGMVMVGGKNNELADFTHYLYAAGGDYFDANGKSAIGSDASQKALTFMVQLAVNDKVTQDGFVTQEMDTADDLFLEGNTGYIMTGGSIAQSYKDSGADFPIEYCKIPVFEGSTGSTLLLTDCIVGLKASTNLKGAGEFIDFLYQDKFKSQLDKQIGVSPVTYSTAELPVFQTPMYTVMTEAVGNGKGLPMISKWNEVADIVLEAIQSCLQGTAAPRRALRSAAQKVDALMAE